MGDIAAMTLDDALKAFRRGTHVNRDHWKCIVFAKTTVGLAMHYDEILRRMEGSSLGVASANEITRQITTNKGSTIRLALASDAEDVRLRLAGAAVTQVIWLHRPTDEALMETRKYLYSPSVAPEDYRVHVLDG